MVDDTQPVHGSEYARNETTSPYLDINQAADYCHLAVQTLYNRRREIERVPGAGRKLLFTREALDRFMTRRPRRP